VAAGPEGTKGGGGGPRGVLIACEGGDGSGKSTQAKRIGQVLEGRGESVVFVREPGGTPLAERIRALLLDTAMPGMSVETEALLYAAARADLYGRVVRSALAGGGVVISDRSLLSSLVYQGHAGGLPVERVLEMSLLATSGVVPDLFLIFDLDVASAHGRLSKPDRMEQKSRQFHQAVREGYLKEAERFRGRAWIVDARGSEDEVLQRAVKAVDRILAERRAGR
jgi:dTMP kinase